MKKALVMLLAVVLVIGMAVPAYAVSSPVGDKTSLRLLPIFPN